jgi:two-component system, OmpR family, sensor histidine kinase QseC
MIRSIRKFLLANLLIAITVTTSLTILGNYFLDQKDIQHHLDSFLTQTGLAFQILLGDDIDTRDLPRLQESLNSLSRLAKQQHEQLKNPFNYGYEDKFQFQVWNSDGTLLLHSFNAPLEQLSDGLEGVSSIKLHKATWRVFTTINPKNNISVVIAERYNIRTQLEHSIIRDDIYIMLTIYPLLGVLIWIIIGKGLSPLTRVANEVSNRAASHLQPVDLTSVPDEIKILVDELNRLFQRLQNAFEREKRFSADAAHELRTPLAVLKSQAQLAMHTKDLDEQRYALNKLVSSVDRSTHVVEQLLTLSRMVNDEAYSTENRDIINLRAVAVDEILHQAPIAVKKNIDIELICPDETVTVVGNATALGIMLRNLLDNAIRYSPENSFVNVQIKPVKEGVLLQVRDNGPGIPPELHARVFERFYRVMGTKQQGSGLGLAIIAQIINIHKASITLDALKEGTGLEINIVFPTAENYDKKSS